MAEETTGSTGSRQRARRLAFLGDGVRAACRRVVAPVLRKFGTIGTKHWAQIADEPLDEVREAILTGYREGKPFSAYPPLLALPPVGRVLDFGCGLGRNFPYLRRIANEVVGFDLPEMIARCRTLDAAESVELTADWEAIRSRHFDAIFASLVLQHLHPDECRRRLQDFAAMAPWTYVLSRGGNDFGVTVFSLIAETPAFEVVEANIVELVPSTGGLRLLRACSSDELNLPAGEGHYEMLIGVRDHPNRRASGRSARIGPTDAT